MLARAQHGAEQLLASAGLGEEALAEVAEAIVQAAEHEAEPTRPAGVTARIAPVAVPEPEETPPAEPPAAAAPAQEDAEETPDEPTR